MRFIGVGILMLVGSFVMSAGSPNVILILTDDQGYGDLACHGNPHISTPHLDKLHAQSIRLTDFHVSHFCTPSRASLMTGRNASQTGAWRTSSGRTMLHTDEVTMAEVFRDSGYATGIFGKWHLGDSYPHRPQDRGFEDTLWHRCGGLTQISDYWGNDYFDDYYEHNGVFEQFDGYCTDVWFKHAYEFIEENARSGKPFFCYIPTNAPHSPFIVAEEYAAPYRDNPDIPNPEFYGMITNLDENVGRLRERISKLGIEEDTILIFMTDNGTAAGIKADSNPDGWPDVGYNAGMRGKKASIYDGGHRVPCFVYWPRSGGNGFTGGVDVPELTAHYDWLPTFIELCNLEAPADLKLDGRSILPLLEGEGQSWEERYMIRQYQGGVFFRFAPKPWNESVVMSEQWRLVNGAELYDIESDLGQRQDVSGDHPEVVKTLRSVYSNWWQDIEPRLRKAVRNHVGNPAENPVVLTAQDWYMEPFGNPVTNQRKVSKLQGIEGPWLLEVEQGGDYRIRLRQYPEEADGVIDAEQAWVRIGGKEMVVPISSGSKEVVFNLHLLAGPARLESAFIEKNGKRTSAYFAYVEYIPDSE